MQTAFFFFLHVHALSKHPDQCHTDKQKTKKIKGTKYKHFQYNIYSSLMTVRFCKSIQIASTGRLGICTNKQICTYASWLFIHGTTLKRLDHHLVLRREKF